MKYLVLLSLLLSTLACSTGDLVVTSAPTQTAVVDHADLAPTQTAIGSGVYWPATPEGGDVVCVTAETALNLRRWAGEDGPILTTLSNGDPVRLVPGRTVSVDGQLWQAVLLLDGGSGWVNASYLGGCG